MTRVISFSSGKGGVGKTSLVSNLGSLWAKAGRNTLLIDGDWSLGKLSIALGVRPQWTVEKVLSGEISLPGAIQGISENLSLLASPSGVMGLEELSEAGRNQLFFEMEQLADQYDLILLDHASGVNWGVLQFAAAAHQHVIVTTPEPTSYTDAYAIMKLLSKRFAIREFWLLITQCQKNAEAEKIIERFSEIARSHLEVRIHLLGMFPWEEKLAESIRRQQAYVALYPNSELTSDFRQVCRKLEKSECPPTSGLQFFYRVASNPLPVR